MLETSNFVHGLAMQSLSLVVSQCFLSGRGQGHVSNFYIVDLENFATASRRYTGDIHNSAVPWPMAHGQLYTTAATKKSCRGKMPYMISSRSVT